MFPFWVRQSLMLTKTAFFFVEDKHRTNTPFDHSASCVKYLPLQFPTISSLVVTIDLKTYWTSRIDSVSDRQLRGWGYLTFDAKLIPSSTSREIRNIVEFLSKNKSSGGTQQGRWCLYREMDRWVGMLLMRGELKEWVGRVGQVMHKMDWSKWWETVLAHRDYRRTMLWKSGTFTNFSKCGNDCLMTQRWGDEVISHSQRVSQLAEVMR